MTADVLAAIRREMNTFSKGQKRIANFILESYDKAAFMTASRLGQTADVSESTVVRFAAELGYDGYPAMQRALQEILRNRLTSVQRIEAANGQLANQDVVSMVMQADINMLRMTNELLDRNMLNAAVDAIVKAKNVFIIGVRSSAAIATFLDFYLRAVLPNIRLVSATATSEMLEQLMHIGKDDVVIGISLPRYSSRTVKALSFCRNCGSTIVAITDNVQAPIAKFADYTLLAKSDMVSFVDSLVAPLSVVNALVVAVSRKLGKEFSQNMEDLEKIWAEYDVYERIDL